MPTCHSSSLAPTQPPAHYRRQSVQRLRSIDGTVGQPLQTPDICLNWMFSTIDVSIALKQARLACTVPNSQKHQSYLDGREAAPNFLKRFDVPDPIDDKSAVTRRFHAFQKTI